MRLTVFDIAAIAHAAWLETAYRFGTPEPLLNWRYCGVAARELAMEAVRARLIHNDTAPEAHNRWVENRIAKGWTLGPKDEAAKTHPNLKPFDELPEPAKAQGYVFDAVVKALAPNGPVFMTEQQIVEEGTA